MSAIPKRKPLPLSAAPLHSQDLPVHHDSEDDSEDDQETPLAAPPIPIRLKAATDGSAVLRTPLLSDDQLRPRTSFSEGKDAELWQHDGDTIVSIGGLAELRIDSSTILKSKHPALIDRLEDLSESDSIEFTECAQESAPGSDAPIRHVIDLAVPAHIDPSTYSGAVRNFFAALHGKPLTGEDLVLELDQLYLTAVDLLGAQDHRDTATKFVRNYVQSTRLDDCRFMQMDAIRLLAWCERTKWEKGWVETFAHCVGMMGSGLVVEDDSSFAELSERTRKLLHASYRKQQLDVAVLEKLFADFHIIGHEMPLENAGRLRAAHAFEQFLLDYYIERMGSWPPRDDNHVTSSWLTRPLAQTLQEDFGALYDYLVDDSVIQYTEPDFQYFLLIHEDASITLLEDASHLCQIPLFRIISNWNQKTGFPPIPHPWPKFPRLRSTAPLPPPMADKTSLIAAVRDFRDVDPVEDYIDIQQAYLQDAATEDNQPSHFVRAFLEHETMTRLDGVNTHDARMGRWLIIYCMLQMLSRLAVDIQGLWYTSGVPYFLNCDVAGCPPWAGAKFPRCMRAACGRDSWAWLYARGMRKRRLWGEQKGRVFTPRYEVHWDEAGTWRLRPLGPATKKVEVGASSASKRDEVGASPASKKNEVSRLDGDVFSE